MLLLLFQFLDKTDFSKARRTSQFFSDTRFGYNSKFGGMDASMMKRMKELEEENRRLKKMYAEEKLKAEIRQEALEGKW